MRSYWRETKIMFVWMKGRKYMNGWMGGWTDGWMNAWMDEWVDGRTDEWMNAWMDEWVDGRTDEWMNAWMDGWMSEWEFERMDGWMNEWMECHMKEEAVNDKTTSFDSNCHFNVCNWVPLLLPIFELPSNIRRIPRWPGNTWYCTYFCLSLNIHHSPVKLFNWMMNN